MKEAEKMKQFIGKNPVSSNPDVSKAVLNELIEEMNRTEQFDSAENRLNFGRIFMKSPITKLAAAAVIIIAGLMCVQFLTGTSAYAQVVAEIKNARTMVYTLIRQANTGTGETIKVDVAYKEPGLLRTTTVDGYIVILDSTSGKMITIVPQGGYGLGDLKDLKSNDGGPFANIETMKSLPAKADEKLGQKEIDGIDCDGYKVTQGDVTTNVWIATETGELVEVEYKYASAPGMNTIMKNIKLNVPLEDSLFSLTPPEGYKPLGEIKSDTSAQTEEKFVEWLGWWANGNVDETFPPMVAGSEIAKAVMDMAKQGKLKGEAWEKVNPGQMFNALLFVANLPKESNWRYAGNGVKLGTQDKAIFWYRPAGSEKYRVIYGDLSVKDVNEADLSK
jgi:outer membrane lipoprotein-sorting protein